MAAQNILSISFSKNKKTKNHPQMHSIPSICNQPKATAINYYKTTYICITGVRRQ